MSSVVTSASVDGASLLERVEERARSAPRTCGIVEPRGETIALGELVARTRLVADALRARGMRPGDRALFSIRPSIAAVEAMLAIHEAGGVAVPMDPRMGNALFEARVRRIAPRWVFADSLLLAASSSWMRRILAWRGVELAPLAALASSGSRGGAGEVTYVRAGRWLPGVPRAVALASLERRARDDRQMTRERAPRESGPRDTDHAFIVFTSGTTGAPRAVVHTRRSLRAILDAVGREIALTDADTLYTRDLHLIIPALLAGARVVLPRETSFEPARVLADLGRQGVTHMFAVTGDCRRLLDHCRTTRQGLPASLRQLMIGGAPARAPFFAALRDILPVGAVAWCIYGMSEILPVATVSIDDKLSYAGPGDIVGRVVPGVGVRVDTAGELHLRGDALCEGYLGEEPVTELATGDLATIDEGRIVLLGRRKDMIIRGDFNLYPELYESTVERIAGVRRAAFVGVYDGAASDERVVLVVEPEAGEDASALASRVDVALRRGPSRIDTAALPDRVLVMPLPEGGRSSKVDKRALRTRVAAMLQAVR